MEHLTESLLALEQTQRQAARKLERNARRLGPAAAGAGLELMPGAKVYDLVSHQVGEVVAGSRENILVPPAHG